MQEGMGLSWHVSFRIDDETGFLVDDAPALVAALAKTPLWSELQVRSLWPDGQDRIGPAKPLGTVASIARLVKRGESVYLARGDRDAFLEYGRPDVRIEISPQISGLALRAQVRGASLARLGPAAIDAVAEMVVDLAVRWRARGVRMSEAWASPTRRPPPFVYPGVRPPRVTRPFREAAAIVEVLDTQMPASARFPATATVTRQLAGAALPEGVQRRERDGVVVLRWVDDPRDAEAVAQAAAAHERWLLALLPSQVAPDWNENGDQRLAGWAQSAAPGLDLLTCTRGQPAAWFGHVAADAVVPPPGRTLPDGTALAELRLLAPSRDVALALVERARAAGYDRVVYRDEHGSVWDPAPP